MNFLAHFHLAWPDDELLAGGLEGDYFKGPLRGQLPPGIERGVALHRAIDGYTDSHSAVAGLREDFPPGLRRFAGILIDLSFDHYLCRYWHEFSDMEQEHFNREVYRSLQQQQARLGSGARSMLGRLVDYDILGAYRDWETVPASAARIGNRFRRGNPFGDVDRELHYLRPALEKAFLAFYPDLLDFVEQHKYGLNFRDGVVSKTAPRRGKS